MWNCRPKIYSLPLSLFLTVPVAAWAVTSNGTTVRYTIITVCIVLPYLKEQRFSVLCGWILLLDVLHLSKV